MNAESRPGKTGTALEAAARQAPIMAWNDAARAAIAELAATGQTFTVTDVTHRVGRPSPAHHLPGSLLAGAHRAGIVRLAGTQLDTTPAGRVVACRQWIGATR